MFHLPLLVLLAVFGPSLSIRINSQEVGARLANCYDYIIVGGGVSGLVVANRLTEDPDVEVLVLEAGDLDDYEDIILNPIKNSQGLGTKYDWNLWTAPQEHLDGATRPYAMGKGVGGGSLINGMAWTRGSKSDYDAWVDLGNPGWGWNDLLPYFKKSEHYTINVDEKHRRDLHIQPNATTHGTEGGLRVSYPQYFYNQSQLFLAALEEYGIPTLSDPNNGNMVGGAIIPNTLSADNQTRSSVRTGFYDGFIDSRPNFHLATGQQVMRLLLNQSSPNSSSGVEISGVEFVSEGSRAVRNVSCRREVILAAGNAHTPKILELSGIGSAEILEKFRIRIVIEIPGVGNNFQDHPHVGAVYYYNNASYFNINRMYDDIELYSELSQQYYENKSGKTGPWTSGAINTVAFLNLQTITANWTDMALDAANQNITEYLLPNLHPTILDGYQAQRKLMIEFLKSSDVPASEILSNNIGLMSVTALRIFSRGSIHIQSVNPLSSPLINPRFCSNPLDCQTLVEALLFNNLLINTTALRLLDPTPYYPFVQGANSDTIMPTIRSSLRSSYHGAGATSMMPLKYGGVVDTKLKVYGTNNLRIVDAGIIPLLPATHLQAAVQAIAEKAADIIKSDESASIIQGCKARSTSSSLTESMADLDSNPNSSSLIPSTAPSNPIFPAPSTFAELLNLSAWKSLKSSNNPVSDPIDVDLPSNSEIYPASYSHKSDAVGKAALLLFEDSSSTAASDEFEVKVLTVVPLPLESVVAKIYSSVMEK